MASAEALLTTGTPQRVLIVGYPGSGKTGAVASLLNAGYKVRVLDFEGNYQPLLAYTKPEALKNLDIMTFQERLIMTEKDYIAPAGIPDAFTKAINAMKRWTYVENGEKVDLGASHEWGLDTVVVVDSLTSLGEVAFYRARAAMNKTPRNTTAAVWGMAVDDQLHFIQKLNAQSNKFHVVVLAHLQMIGPDTPMSAKDESSDIKELKEQIAVEKAALIDTRLYPKAVTKNSSMAIHKEFPVLFKAERRRVHGKMARVLAVDGGEEIDVKFPTLNKETVFPIETGLATIFEILGAKAPGLKD